MDAPRIRRRVARNARRMLPRPSTVLALVALAVALGGTGYAATLLPAGSVGTAQLKNGAVISSKVKDGSLRAAGASRHLEPHVRRTGLRAVPSAHAVPG
jgi:hypothetical protein